MPTAVVLSMCIGIGGCVCPISCNVSRMILACCALWNSAASSAAAADAATIFKIVHREWMDPLSLIFVLFLGMELRKKCPPALLLAFDAVKYEASECMLRIMSDALYRIVAF